MGIGIVGEIPLAKARPAAVPVRNIICDGTVATHTHTYILKHTFP